MGTRRSGLAGYVVDAVLLEGRSAREVARAHGISKRWIYELIGRYRQGGYEALEPRPRRPRSCKHATPERIVQAILELREQLQDDGMIAVRRRSPTTSPKGSGKSECPPFRRSGGFCGEKG